MKIFTTLALLCIALAANAAVPDYKAFRGTGGITITSNPPNGTIVIDGSAISAGVTPAYAITNNYDAANTFTNLGQLRQSGFATFMGLATNNNDLTVRDALWVIGTNSNPFVVMNAHSNRTAQFLVQTYSDIEASPSAVLAGRDLGSLEFLGYGSANLELGAKFEVVALQNFAATESSSRILLHVGDSTGGANGYIASSWDANLMSNNVASFFKSNVTFAAFVDIPTSLDSASFDSVVTVRSTDADQANNVYLLNLNFVDNQDANAFYAKFSGDSGGAPTDDYVFGQTSFSILPPSTFYGGVTIDDATANRVAIFNGSKDLTNHADMRLGASLSGASDGDVLKYHAASGTWTNGTDAGGSVGPGSLAFNLNQFDTNATVSLKSGALATNLSARGLNLPTLGTGGPAFVDASNNLTNDTEFTYDSSGNTLGLSGTLGTAGYQTVSATTTSRLYSAGILNWSPLFQIVPNNPSSGASFHFYSDGTDAYFGPSALAPISDSGRSAARWRTNYSERVIAGPSVTGVAVAGDKSGAFVIQPTNILAGATITVPTTLTTTSILSLSLSAPATAGQSLKVHSVSGTAPQTIIITNDTVTGTASGIFNFGLTNTFAAAPSISPPGAGGLVHLNGTNQNWYVSASSNVLVVLTNLLQDVNYSLTVSNGANVSVVLSNAAAIPTPCCNAGEFPGFRTNGLTTMVFRHDSKSGSTNLLAYQTFERTLILANGVTGFTNNTTGAISVYGGYFTNSLITGVGGANTNFTLSLPDDLEGTINGFTNVSIRAVMGYDDSKAKTIYWNLMITNYSGSDRTIEFSVVTNRWRFSGAYGTNAPTTLTNQTALLISGRSQGTNTQVGYSYFPGPL